MVDPTTNGCRLSFSTNPVPVDEVAIVASSVRLLPYKSDKIALWDGSAWQLGSVGSGGISLAFAGLVANTNYDIFVSGPGAPVLNLVAWTNDTTRAVGLGRQDGVLIRIATPAERYVGTMRATGAANSVDTGRQRFLWNYYNRVLRKSRTGDTTSMSWVPGGVFAQMEPGFPTIYNQQFVIGVDEDNMVSEANIMFRRTALDPTYRLAVSESPTALTFSRSILGGTFKDVASGLIGTDSTPVSGSYVGRPGAGFYNLYGIDQVIGSVGAAGIASSSNALSGSGAMTTYSWR